MGTLFSMVRSDGFEARDQSTCLWSVDPETVRKVTLQYIEESKAADEQQSKQRQA